MGKYCDGLSESWVFESLFLMHTMLTQEKNRLIQIILVGVTISALRIRILWFFLIDNVWCAKSSFLPELFAQLNKLNKSMQGSEENLLSCTDKLFVFKKKLNIWTRYITEHNLEMKWNIRAAKNKNWTLFSVTWYKNLFVGKRSICYKKL